MGIGQNRVSECQETCQTSKLGEEVPLGFTWAFQHKAYRGLGSWLF